jgi:SAM-dependent methyltransferase
MSGIVTNSDLPTHADDRRNSPQQAVFQQAWRIYRILIDQNYMFHREAYACLRQVLVEGIGRPFRFLDIACGDATPSVEALQGTAITAYFGIDLSEAALDLARETLAALSCPVTLVHADFVIALETWTAPVDVAWIGFSLHHMTRDEKRAVLRLIRIILPADGHLLFYEDTSPDGESRDGWLARWDAQQPSWTAYSMEDWTAITTHVHDADYPETVSTWAALASEAGFAEAREVYVAPSDLFRLFWLPVTASDASLPGTVVSAS